MQCLCVCEEMGRGERKTGEAGLQGYSEKESLVHGTLCVLKC